MHVFDTKPNRPGALQPWAVAASRLNSIGCAGGRTAEQAGAPAAVDGAVKAAFIAGCRLVSAAEPGGRPWDTPPD